MLHGQGLGVVKRLYPLKEGLPRQRLKQLLARGRGQQAREDPERSFRPGRFGHRFLC